jgi:hypothetical protein
LAVLKTDGNIPFDKEVLKVWVSRGASTKVHHSVNQYIITEAHSIFRLRILQIR